MFFRVFLSVNFTTTLAFPLDLVFILTRLTLACLLDLKLKQTRLTLALILDMEMERKKPFTDFEKSLLTNLISQYATTIDCKKTDAKSAKEKAEAWSQVTELFNSSSRISQKAKTKELKKFWNNMKAKAREAKTVENQRNYTGGGPSIPDMDTEHIQVLSVINKPLPAIKVQDSDAVQRQSDDDDDGVYWLHNKSRGRTTAEIEIEVPVETEKKTETMIMAEPAVAELQSMDVAPTAVPETVPGPSSSRASMVPSAVGNKPYSVNRRRCNTEPSSIDKYKIKIMEQDLKQREEKFKVEMNHLKVMHDLEVAHKKEMNRLMEEELQLKIKILKQNKDD